MIDCSKRNSRLAFWAALLLVVVVASVVLAANVPVTSFRGDESGWISAGYTYADLLAQGSFAWDQWACPSCGPWGGLNPHLGKLLIGVPLALYSDLQLDGARFDRYYSYDETLEQNEAAGRVPPGEILLAARRASLLFGVLSCAALFALAALSANLATGLLAAGLLLTNQVFVASATSAMTDIHYLFFLLCLALAVLWLAARPATFQRAALVAGVCAGLATSIKVSGVAVGGLLLLLVLVACLLVDKLRVRQGLLALGLFALAAVVVVYLLNPFFWPSFVALEPAAVLSELQGFLGQSKRFGMLVEGIPAQRYPQLAQLVRPLGFPLMVQRWNVFMDSQASIAGWTGGVRPVEISQTVAANLSSVPLLWVALLVGLANGAGRLWRSYRSGSVSLLSAPLAFFVANYAVILFMLKLNWPRYYLPTLVGAVVLAALGISATIGYLLAKGGAWLSARRAAPLP